MLDMPILKFEKSTKYLQNQLQVQTNNKQLVLDIITNIGLILNDDSIQDKEKYESVLDSANLFLQTITNNITTIEQLDLEIKNITKELNSLLSEKDKPSKTKEFYIAAFTNIKQTIVVYSKKIKQLEDRLTIDNNNFNDFITENNIQYNYEKSHNTEDSDVYEFTSFSVDDDVAQLEQTESKPASTLEENLEENSATVSAEDENDSNEIDEINVDKEAIDIDIDVDDISNDILSQASVENIVNDYELAEKNEKIDKLTNEFRNILVEASSSNDYNAESVISLFKKVLPNINEINLFEESKTDFKAENVGDLITEVIKEATQPKEIPEYDFNGFNMSSIITEFDIASVEGENKNIEKLRDELNSQNPVNESPNEIDLGVIELPPVSDAEGIPLKIENLGTSEDATTTDSPEIKSEENVNIDLDDIDSLLSLITEEDLEQFDAKHEEKNNGDSEEESDEDSLTFNSINIEDLTETEDEEESTEDSEPQDLSYSEMYRSFYPTSQPEETNNSIDFSSLENSFKEFDKILNKNKVDSKNESSSTSQADQDNVNSLADTDLLDLFSDDLENNIIEESIVPNLNTTKTKPVEKQTVSDEIVVNEKTNTDITVLFDKQIEKILEGKTDNETLLISERTEKIYLPYKTTELLNYIHSYPNLYKSLGDVVKQEFVLPYTYFTQHPSKSRFSEAYNLIRNREGKNVFSATAFAIKMSQKRNLNPAIIASCKSKAELDSYLYCLNNNRLESFKDFKIAYEINPTI